MLSKYFTLFSSDGSKKTVVGHQLVPWGLLNSYRVCTKKDISHFVSISYGLDHGLERVNIERPKGSFSCEYELTISGVLYTYCRKYVVYDGFGRIVHPDLILSWIFSLSSFKNLDDHTNYPWLTRSRMGSKGRKGGSRTLIGYFCKRNAQNPVMIDDFVDYEPPIRGKAKSGYIEPYCDYFKKELSNWKHYRKKQYK